MLLIEDRGYLSNLDLKAIENGMAELGVHSLSFDRHYSEEQKQNNMKLSYTMTKEQWNERCEKIRVEIGNKIKNVIDIINEKFDIYQYTNEEIDYSQDDWDLFFWCNMTKDYEERDMSYVTLNPNKKRSNAEQVTVIESVLDLIKDINIEGIKVTIQYKAIYNDERVQQASMEYCEKMKNQLIDYGGYIGKIVPSEEHGYLFRKKGAKKRAYHINHKTILKNILVVHQKG